YRLYSQRDVDLVRRMQALLETGLAPSEAARQVLREAPAPDRGPPEEDLFGLAVRRIIAAVEALDTAALQTELRRALLFDSGIVAFRRILRPALIEIGDLWHAGRISVASEHLAAHMIAATLLDLMRLMPVPSDADRVLLACFPEEQHVIPLYGVSLDLASWGYRPIVLGARTPPSAIARAIEAVRPALVGLSVTIPPATAGLARETVDAYADVCRDVPWMVGGAAADGIAEFVENRGGHVVHTQDEDSRQEIDRLVGRRAALPRTGATSPTKSRPKRTKSKRA
ncbi:MAG TPA: cobalamin B12-binding domain-containing protein, partial [Polyangiaceae bacterium]|nr:cobalamin B12-binding domain-containing protein [Polyangiaceae bacterium]